VNQLRNLEVLGKRGEGRVRIPILLISRNECVPDWARGGGRRRALELLSHLFICKSTGAGKVLLCVCGIYIYGSVSWGGLLYVSRNSPMCVVCVCCMIRMGICYLSSLGT